MPTDWGGGAGADIGRTLLELGRIRGENSVQQGNIWGHAIANIGSTIENAPLIQMRQQEMQARTAELQGLAQDRQLKVQQAQRLAAGQQALAQLLRDPANLDQSTGMVDHRKVATALGQQGFADMGESYLKQAAANEEAFGKIDEQKQKYLGIVGRGAAKVNSPEDFTTMLSVAGQLNVPPVFLDHISKEADKLGPDGWKVVSQKLADMTGDKPKYAPLPENSAGVVNESTGQITPTGQPRVFKNETELLSDAANPNSPTQAQSKDALALKGTGEKENEFTAFRKAYGDAAGGQPWDSLSPQQRLAGIEKFKTLSTDASAVAAANRQAIALQAQVDQQARAQGFAESQAGKKEYTEKVATPYQTALASAQTLRDTVSAAKGGNMVAANMQNLETAMAAIRSQGLNRINMSEIGVAGDAGSLWDRVQNAYGKMTKGQSVDAALQKDILQFADILEKSATVKYQKGRDSLLSTFKGMDIPNEAAPQATAPAAPTTPTVGATVMFQGKRYKVTGIRNGAATLEAIP